MNSQNDDTVGEWIIEKVGGCQDGVYRCILIDSCQLILGSEESVPQRQAVIVTCGDRANTIQPGRDIDFTNIIVSQATIWPNARFLAKAGLADAANNAKALTIRRMTLTQITL
jgi:hypothetical protein